MNEDQRMELLNVYYSINDPHIHVRKYVANLIIIMILFRNHLILNILLNARKGRLMRVLSCL